jgi:hypothetical protein
MKITTANGQTITLHSNYGRSISEIIDNVIKESGKSKKHPGYADAMDIESGKWFLLSVQDCNLVSVDDIEKPVVIGGRSLLASEYELCDGYIGAMGKLYETTTDETIVAAIRAAAKISKCSEIDIVEKLVAGNSVVWCIVDDDYHNNSKGFIRRKRSSVYIEMVECDCGHTVRPGERMKASLGTCCPNCYDTMS